MDARRLLSGSKLFAELDDGEIAALEAIVSYRQYPAESMLFFEGDEAPGFHVLVSGAVRIFKASAEGREYTLHHIAPGQVFAEAAIFRSGRYPANCMATRDSTVALFPKDKFIALLGRYPQIALKLIGSLSAWLREFTLQLEQLSLKEVPARLADYLVRQAQAVGADEFDLDCTKSELATRLGTISETLSRSLAKLKAANVIAVHGGRIRILDRTVLAAVSRGEKIPSN